MLDALRRSGIPQNETSVLVRFGFFLVSLFESSTDCSNLKNSGFCRVFFDPIDKFPFVSSVIVISNNVNTRFGIRTSATKTTTAINITTTIITTAIDSICIIGSSAASICDHEKSSQFSLAALLIYQ